MSLIIAELDIQHLDCFSSFIEPPATAAHVASDRHGDVFALHSPDGVGLDEFYTRVGQQLGQTPRILGRTDTDIILRARVSAHGVDSCILRAGATILLPAAFARGHEYYRVLAPDKEVLTRVVKHLRRIGDVEVASVKRAEAGALDVSITVGSLAAGLTEKQLDLVQFAQAQGYYDIPRGATTAALAKSVGLDRSTVDEHLRKAERAIVRSTLRVLDAHPVLTRGLAKRRGRPAEGPAKMRAAKPPRGDFARGYVRETSLQVRAVEPPVNPRLPRGRAQDVMLASGQDGAHREENVPRDDDQSPIAEVGADPDGLDDASRQETSTRAAAPT